MVWPLATTPRVVPWDVSEAVARLKAGTATPALPKWSQPHLLPGRSRIAAADVRTIQEDVLDRLVTVVGKAPSVARDADTLLGALFPKEIDVVMARYDRGLELGVSTKTMLSSFDKNLANRREEASGDLLNIRRRFPFAVFGYLFLVDRDLVLTGSRQLRAVIDMCWKLSDPAPGYEEQTYDAACVLPVQFKRAPRRSAHGRLDERDLRLLPAELRPPHFFECLLDRLLTRAQPDDHAVARAKWQAAGRGL
jgi:hypothetical protein